MEELRRLVAGRTVALLGESGAGKSSIVNALLGTEAAAIGEVRAGDAKGRHTTTTRELHQLDDGGVLIDSPGIREVGLVGETEAVEETFAEVAEVAETCRFSDCGRARAGSRNPCGAGAARPDRGLAARGETEPGGARGRPRARGHLLAADDRRPREVPDSARPSMRPGSVGIGRGVCGSRRRHGHVEGRAEVLVVQARRRVASPPPTVVSLCRQHGAVPCGLGHVVVSSGGRDPVVPVPGGPAGVVPWGRRATQRRTASITSGRAGRRRRRGSSARSCRSWRSARPPCWPARRRTRGAWGTARPWRGSP